MHVGRTVKQILKDRRISHQSFAEKLGITRSYLAATLLEKESWKQDFYEKAESVLEVNLRDFANEENSFVMALNEVKSAYDKVILSKDETIQVLKNQCSVLERALLK